MQQLVSNPSDQGVDSIPQYVDGLPTLSGFERAIDATVARTHAQPAFLHHGGIDFSRIKSASAIALHMHQPLIPAGGAQLGSARLISNLQAMFENMGVGDNHNAPVFQWCYKRMGEFIPQLIAEGKQPRVMLEYSGVLLHGLREMGLGDVIDALKNITMNPAYWGAVEWLGCPWGHAVAPSTPVQDFKLHVRAWQHHFASVFGMEALGRVRGFSPSEMALPNHPDTAYEFVKTLRECGYSWVLVQEHTVEQPSGAGVERKHIPHRLICRNADGEEVSIIAIVKTQGSDTKLVAQMQPYYEAAGLSRWELGGKFIPPLVTQIADGENGGVMMNEFPSKFFEVVRQCAGSETVLMNCTEYLEHLFDSGITESDLPLLQPQHQHRIWQNFQPGQGRQKLGQVIQELSHSDHRFSMEGGSWTNNISWVKGYDNVLDPIDKFSSAFYEITTNTSAAPTQAAYRNALFHLLVAETSCYRYWGQGMWTDYAIEICRRGMAILNNDF
jgi:hypothetical protein